MFELSNFKGLDFATATISLWVFKASGSSADPKFNSHWVEIGNDVKDALRGVISSERARITEVADYSLLAQTNEASALSIASNETFIDRIETNVAAETPQKRAVEVKKLLNSSFYVIKILVGTTTILGIKKTTAHWRTKKAKGIVPVLFDNSQLVLNTNQAFEILRSIDFFVYGGSIAILNKPNFESILKYKAAHVNDFAEMQSEQEFIDLFATILPLNEYVDNNKIQLRRASAIRLKGHYKDDAFMQRLRDHGAEYGLNITFNAAGQIVPSPETCRDIFQALLDHRLRSAFSLSNYDVDDTQRV